MNLNSRYIAGGGVAGIAAIWLISIAADRVYFAPRDAHLAEIEELRQRVDVRESAVDGAFEVDDAIAAYADRTLGPDQETVDHRLRTRLNRLAEEVGLEGAVVSTGGTAIRQSPARRKFRGSGLRHLRDEVDFIELDGSIAGQGSLEQVVSLVDRIDAEPWLKRIDQVRMEPKNNGERFVVTVRLTTLFLPGRDPSQERQSDWTDARLVRFQPLLDANPFRIPPPPPPPPERVVKRKDPPKPPPRPKPPKFPWSDWILTGVAEAGEESEAWLRNRASGETRRLVLGQNLNSAELAGIAADWAEFRLEKKRFRVRLGRSLNDRTAIND